MTLDVALRPYWPLPEFVVPAEGVFWQVRHDFETDPDSEEWGGRPRSLVIGYKKHKPYCALPETAPLWGCRPNDFIPLSSDWQFFWFELLKRAAGGFMSGEALIAAWTSLVADHRALTDGHAPENGFADFVTGRNVGNPKGPLQIKCLSFGGNIVRQIRDLGTRVEIQTMDPSLPPPSVDEVWEKPWLVQWATQETVVRLDGGRFVVLPFPQIRREGKKGGTPFPLVGLGGRNLIEKKRLRRVGSGKFSPYVLQRGG